MFYRGHSQEIILGIVYLWRVNAEDILLSSILMIRRVFLYTHEIIMRTNIVLDDSLVAEALGGCPRIEAVARESGFESIFLIK